MKLFFRVLGASFMKEMRVWSRNRTKLLLLTLLPLVFFFSFTLLMGGVYSGPGVDTALVVHEQSPGYYTNGLIDILYEPDDIPPRLRILPMEADEAQALFDNGDILLIITIPAGFESALAGSESTYIHITVANIHEDLTKNLRMPVIRKLDIFYQTYLGDDARVSFDEEDLRPYTPPRLGYMSWTISVYAVIFGALYAGGSAMTQEFEQETFGEIDLSGRSIHAIHFGKIASGTLLAYLPVPLVFILGYLMYGAWPRGDLLVYLSLTGLIAVFCASLGLLFGALLRNAVFMVPVAALGSVFYWIVGGGIAPLEIAGVRFGILDEYAPFSNVYRSVVRMFIEGSYGTLMTDVTVCIVFAGVALVACPILANRVSRLHLSGRILALKQKRRQLLTREQESR
jgi:hypothetical protein